MTNKIVPYLIAVAVGIVIGYFLFKSSNQVITETITITDTVYQDTGTHHVSFVPEPIYIYTQDTLWKTIDIDTTAILQDYFAVRGYQDTVVNDTSLTISYVAVVNKNTLKGIKFSYKNNRYSIINNTDITNKTIIKYRYSVGCMLQGNTDYMNVIPYGSVRFKNINFIGGYGIQDKSFIVGAGITF